MTKNPRISVTLPEKMVKLIDEAVAKANEAGGVEKRKLTRSSFIALCVTHFAYAATVEAQDETKPTEEPEA